MRNAEHTRMRIRRQAAELFNIKGYAGASLSDIMQATALEKGGIYHHFGSKEQLALEAFDYAADVVRQRFLQAQDGKHDSRALLVAFVDLFRSYIERPPLRGGCPVLNTAIESDDTHPVLAARARSVVDEWRTFVTGVVEQGKQRGEVVATVDGDALATLMIATLEGGLMLTKLYDDGVHLHRAAAYLTEYLERVVQPTS